jgi:regulator of protease activity HflC (stomatin/prohibitin superfamily)
MSIFRRILVGDQNRVLLIRKGRFARMLEPGEYWIWTLAGAVETVTFNINDLTFESPWADYLVKQRAELAARLFTIVETNDAQVAAVYLNGKLSRVLGPGKRVLYWRGSVEVAAEVIDVNVERQLPAALAAILVRMGTGTLAVSAVVEEGKTGLLFVDGRFVRALGPGAYVFWNVAGSPRVEQVDLRLQTVEIPGQEILTRDKVSIRVNVWAEFQVTDAVQAKQSVKDYTEHLYRALQLAVRQTLGRRTLEEILAEKVDIDEQVAAEVRREMQSFGVRVGAIALKDVILPGEMREILNQVVTAEKQAQANLIRRREETAATRSLLNTAKLMEDNPLLVRLKELETLEKVAEKVGKITVNGGFDALLSELVTLRERT